MQNGTLPQVSWIVAPEAYSEHPNWPANFGAWYVDQVLQVLTSNPAVWSKTALLITYDENDGFFDHLAPPFAAWSSASGRSTVDTANEYFAGNGTYPAGPYGLGPRVPMIVVSPWSRGGWVCSETFDHTSIIRFIEKRFGRHGNLGETNITPWRRAVCGDLTRAFDFSNPNAAFPALPGTTSYVPPDHQRHPDYVPVPPLAQSKPKQEPGVRPARALPYELSVRANARAESGTLHLEFVNTGEAGAAFLAYRPATADAPRSYTVEAKKRLTDDLPLNADRSYRFVVHGPNGFVRGFAGKATALNWLSGGTAVPQVTESYVAGGNIALRLENAGTSACTFGVANAYDGSTVTRKVAGGQSVDLYVDLRAFHGWYDLTVTVDTDASFSRTLAGHVETGKSSMSDPALGAS